VSLLEVGCHETAVPQCAIQARMSEKPSRLIEADAVPKPRGSRKMPQPVGMQAAIRGQPRLGAEAVEDLDQMAECEGLISDIHEKVILATYTDPHRQIVSNCTHSRRGDKCHPVFLSLAGANEETALLQVPILNQEAQHLASAQPSISHYEDERAVPRAHQRWRAAVQYCA